MFYSLPGKFIKFPFPSNELNKKFKRSAEDFVWKTNAKGSAFSG